MNSLTRILPLATAALMSACAPSESERIMERADRAQRLQELAGTRVVQLVSGRGERVKHYLASGQCYISDLHSVRGISDEVLHRFHNLLSENGRYIRLAEPTNIDACTTQKV